MPDRPGTRAYSLGTPYRPGLVHPAGLTSSVFSRFLTSSVVNALIKCLPSIESSTPFIGGRVFVPVTLEKATDSATVGLNPTQISRARPRFWEGDISPFPSP